MLIAFVLGVTCLVAGLMLRPMVTVIKWLLIALCPYGIILAADFIRGARQALAMHKADNVVKLDKPPDGKP